MKALRRMMAGLVCAALLFGRAAGEASFDFTDGMPDVPETAAPTENPAPTITLSPAFEMTVIRPAAQQHHGAILIYHTHTWEAYRQTDERYQETEKWRTKDERYNVVAVGEALTRALTALGYTVVHDTTAFEPPKLADAYARSLTMLEQRTASGETYDLYIDLHRDAISSPPPSAAPSTSAARTRRASWCLSARGQPAAIMKCRILPQTCTLRSC